VNAVMNLRVSKKARNFLCLRHRGNSGNVDPATNLGPVNVSPMLLCSVSEKFLIHSMRSP
jgi:hypothetical protein